MSPGPNGVLVFRTTSLYGKQAAFYNIIGFIFAVLLQGSFGVFGISAILISSPYFFMILKYIGGGYFLYIGAKMLMGPLQSKEASFHANIKHYAPPKIRKSLLEGFVTQFSNPKGILFYLAAFPQFLNFDKFYYIDAYILVAIHSSVLLLWFSLLSALIVKMQGNVKGTKAGGIINKLAGVVMVYFGSVLFLQ